MSLLAVFTIAFTSHAQITEGTVVLEIIEASSSDPQMGMISMLKGATTTISFNEDQSVTTMDMMGGMVKTSNFINSKTNQMDMLMDAMGNKIWVASTLEEGKKQQQQPGIEEAEIVHDKSDTKKILGYEAHKVTIKIPNTEGMVVSGYVTDEIKTDASVIQGTEGLKLEGFPLEFTINNPQMKLVIQAKEISKEVDTAALAPNTEGYTKMSMEEFSKSMGGMGGGLGF